MIEYPPKPASETGQFAPEVFPAIAEIPVPGLRLDDVRSSPVSYEPPDSRNSFALRPAVKIEFGVNAVWVEGGGKRSRSYNNGVNGAKGQGGEEGFYFAPMKDGAKLKIGWEVHHPHFIESARLELFCHHLEEPVWARNWGGLWGTGKPIDQFCGRAKNDGTQQGSMPWIEVELPKELFAHEILTVARSPYLLKLSVSAREGSGDPTDKDRFGYPLVAWTHLHVLVRELKLHWGKPEAIPRERTDIALATKAFKTRGMDKTLTELLDRETSLLKTLRTKSISEDQDIRIEAGVFDYNSFQNAHDEAPYYNDMWGEGPLVPLCAAVTIKSIAGDEGVREPEALGDLPFLWDWQDNEGEVLKDRLDAWLGDAGAQPDQRSTRITRYFLEETWKRFASAAYPHHAYNCPAPLGGKRGAKSPRDTGQTSVVFPEWAGKDPFPFVVKTADNRTWASISTTTEKDVASLCDQEFDTAVLFQPTTIAGDRYKIAVYVMPWTSESPDQDKKGASCYDLKAEAAALPHDTTGFYTIWRTMKATYYASHSFYGGIDATINAIKARLKRELGFIATIEKKPFPDLQGQVDSYLEATIKAKDEYQSYSKAIFLYMAIARLRARDNDYAFDAVEDNDEYWDKIVDLFGTAPLQAIQPNDALQGKAIRAASGAKGVVLNLPDDYQTRGYGVVLLLSGRFNDNEEVTALTKTGEKQNLRLFASQPVFAKDCTIDVGKPQGKTSSRQIEVNMPGREVKVELDYSEGKVRPTRRLNEDRTTQLDDFLTEVGRQHDGSGPLTLKVLAKNTDTREQERVRDVRKHILSNIVERDKLLDKFWNDTVSALDPDKDKKKGLVRYANREVKGAFRDLFNIALVAYAKAAPENTNWQTEGRTVFYHLRGRTRLDSKFTTGGIENNYCEEKFGISGLTVPAITARDRVEKRWLKDPIVVAVHEFGHSLFLRHSRQRFFDSKTATGVTAEHLAHDTCIMNYDADSSAFCAVCLLRKRGWMVHRDLITPALGQESGAWAQKCLDLMDADVKANTGDPTVHVRLAMYTLAVKKFLGDDDKRVPAAKALMATAETLVPTAPPDNERRVWMLRNLVIFHRNLLQSGDSQQTDVERYGGQLKNTSDFQLDVDVITAAGLGVWSNAP